MAKFFGKIGFATLTETTPGVWEEVITERDYYGEVIRNNRRLQGAQQLNDDISLSNEFSILADPFAVENFHSMRYLTYMGTKWKVTTVDVQYPRLTLSVGGIYNG
jgi:hypothetical protein